jgi:hypothetical protein
MHDMYSVSLSFSLHATEIFMQYADELKCKIKRNTEFDECPSLKLVAMARISDDVFLFEKALNSSSRAL